VLLVVGWLWLAHGQRPGRLTAAGALAAVAGLGLVLDLLSGADVSLVGVLWGLGAAVGLATYFVVSAGDEDALPPLVVAWSGLAVGGVVLVVAGLVHALPVAAPRTQVVLLDHRVSWLVPVVGLSLVAAVVAYVAGILAVRLLGSKVASFVGLTEVLFAVLFAWLLLGQALAVVQLAGGVLVVAGIALVQLDERRTPVAVPEPLPASPVGAPH
jgi:drug/metabolite transporter (DMT)-like permease